MRTKVEEGFSLIELLIAMVVTLIMSGAIVGLLTTGQRTFEIQPEQADRQQNARAAMNMVMRDVATAGAGVPAYVQAFSQGLNAVGIDGASGERTDELMIMTNTSGVSSELVCDNPGSSGLIRLSQLGTNIPEDSMVFIMMADGTWTVRRVNGVTDNQANTCQDGVKDPTVTPGADAMCPAECQGNFRRDQVDVRQGGEPDDGITYNTPGGVCNPSPSGLGNVVDPNCVPMYVTAMDVIHYRVNPDANGVPCLERRSAASGAGWQVVARGIEDFQVRYRDAGAAPDTFDDQPAQVVLASPQTLTVEVEVVLSSRSELEDPRGAGTKTASRATGDALDPGQAARIRGALISRAAPRATLYELANDYAAIQADLWR